MSEQGKKGSHKGSERPSQRSLVIIPRSTSWRTCR